ncbi:hypothetical protein Maes01_02010 [Microbulbifer aestuariivivens]|uniref:Uncharacterized protein n=1 Tax=Microbulbifer aestuariivivens TaxID=1908308 RepID=A0ABP9WQG1_9GAMM
MLAIFFAALSLSHLGLLVWSLRQPSIGLPIWFLRCLLLALALDNMVIALAPLLLESPVYGVMSMMRFWIHAILLPGLLVFAAYLLQRYVASERIRVWLPRLGWALAIIAITYGYVFELAPLELVVADYYPRMISADSQPPLATIAVNLLVIVAGIWLWRVAQWPWLFAGALQIFLVNGASAGLEWAFIVGNSAELLFALSLLATLAHIQKDATSNVDDRSGDSQAAMAAELRGN